MECSNLRFVNLTRNDNYVWNNGEYEKFWSISTPLLEMIEHKLKGNYLYAEDYFIKFLQHHRTTISANDVAILSRHMSTCIFHAYVLVITMVLSMVVGIPVVCCMKTCHKKSSKPSKNRYCFFAEGVILFMAICFLCIGAVSDWYVGITAQRLLDKLPLQTRQLLEDYDQNLEFLNDDGEVLRGNITGVVDFAVKKAESMPKSISTIVKNYCGFTTTQTLLLTNLTTCLRMLSQSFDTLRDKDNQPKLPNLSKQLTQTLNNLTSLSVITDTSALDLKKTFTDKLKSNHKFPDYGKISGDFHAILHKVMPEMTGRHKAELRQQRIGRIAFSRVESLIKRMKRVQDLSITTTQAVTRGMDALIPEKVKHSVANVTLAIERFVQATSFSRNAPTIFSKGSTWMLLAPSLFGFTVLFLLVIALSGMYKEYHSISQGKISAPEYRNVSYKILLVISVTFLWLILLMAVASYILHIPLAILCGSIKKEALFSRYLDQNLWNNNTCLSYNLKDFLSVNHSLRARDVLNRCSRNGTLFSCLGLEKAIRESIGSNELMHELNCFKNDVIRELTQIFNETTAHFDKIDDNLNLETNLRLNGVNTSNLTISFFDEEAAKLIEELNLNVLENFRELLEIKSLISSAKGYLGELKYLMVQNENGTMHDCKGKVAYYFSEISKELSCPLMKTMNFVENSLLQTIGKCSILPYAYNKLMWMTCDWILPVLATWWIALSITAFSTIVSLFLSCKLLAQVQGVRLIFLQRQHISSFGRYSNRQVALPS